MSTGRTVAVVLVSILLTTTIIGASVTTAAERTAFDGEYVGETFESEGVHTQLTAEIRSDVSEDIDRATEQQMIPAGITIELDGEQAAERSITETFVAGELNANIRELYQFLRGNDDELQLVTDFRDVKENLESEIIESTAIDTPQLIGTNSARIDEQRVAMLSESPEEFEDAQMELNESERTEIEMELETNVRSQLSDEDEALTAAIIDHQTTVLDGLTGELSHDEYVEQLAADEQQIKVELAAVALRDVPDDEPLFGEDEDPESEFAPFATMIQWGITLAWLLPLLAVGLVGVVYAVTRSIDRTASITGLSLLVAGIVGVLFGFVFGPLAGRAGGVERTDSDPVIDGLVAVFEGTLQTIGVHSLLVGILGGIVLALVLADRRGKLERLRDTLGIDQRGPGK